MVLDECLAHPADVDAAPRVDGAHAPLGAARAASAFSTLRAAVRSTGVDSSPIPGQAQFGIVQGGVYPELREESARGTVAIGFEAYAIGGLSVGEPTDVMYEIVAQHDARACRRTGRAI